MCVHERHDWPPKAHHPPMLTYRKCRSLGNLLAKSSWPSWTRPVCYEEVSGRKVPCVSLRQGGQRGHLFGHHGESQYSVTVIAPIAGHVSRV